jgi:hypothetical protein
MYINFGNFRQTVDFNGAYEFCFAVESKKEGHIGSIYFIRDENGVGSIAWCEGNIAKGYGLKIDLEELFNLLKKREIENGK